ncbi:MAG: CoA-binding protein [Nitrospiraceae bacterium]|nr:CoA-binding protein [Nitrospiraceae bacterium]
MKALEALFNPRSIAVFGAAHTEAKLGGTVMKNLLPMSRKASIFPINPKYGSIMGIKSLRSAAELPGRVDLAILMRPAPEVPGILRELANRASFAIIVSAGFAEAGEAGLQEEVKKAASQGGIRVVGPNCMGIFNTCSGLDTLILPPERLRRPACGNVAVTTQSGAVMSSVFESMVEGGIGTSITAHYGNAADIDESDVYEYLADDDQTSAVISYIESVRDGRRFLEKASALSLKKPLLVLKAGKGRAGQAAAFSHTGRLAGRYEVFRSVMRQFGLREAATFEELIDGAKALSYQRPKKGRSVFIITNGGGAGVLASDESARQGLQVNALPKDKLKKLKALFPPFYAIGNPLDLTAQVRDEDYQTVLNEIKDGYDGFVIIALSAVTGITEKLGGILSGFIKDAGKPAVFHTGRDAVGKQLALMAETAGIPCYPTPERCVRALGKLLE